MDTEITTTNTNLQNIEVSYVVSAIGMYWTVRDDKGLLLGNTCEELRFALPDFIVKGYTSVDTQKDFTTQVICTMYKYPLQNELVRIELELAKGVPPEYIESHGEIVIHDLADKQLVDSLRHSTGAGRCGICGLKVKTGAMINFCCINCYSNIRTSLKNKGIKNIAALSDKGLAIIRKLQGDSNRVCRVCNNAEVSDNSETCDECSDFLSMGCTIQ